MKSGAKATASSTSLGWRTNVKSLTVTMPITSTGVLFELMVFIRDNETKNTYVAMFEQSNNFVEFMVMKRKGKD